MFITKAVQKELTMQYRLKQPCFIRRNGTKRPITTVVFGNTVGDRIQKLKRGFFLSDSGEGIKVTGIGSMRDFGVPVDVCHSFTHRNPCVLLLPLSIYLSVDLKTSWVVYGCLDPQHATLLIVHFDRVLCNPVLYAYAFDSFADSTHNLTAKSGIAASLEETHHILRAKMFNRMVDKSGIQFFKTGSILEDNIGSILSLSNSPVVAMQIKSETGLEQRIKSLAKSIQEAMSVSAEHGLGYLLRFLNILNLYKTILTSLIRYACFIHLSCKPFPTIHTDLDRTGKPALKPNVHKAKFPIKKVKIKMNTLANGWNQLKLFYRFAFLNSIRLTWLNVIQNTNQSIGNTVSLHNSSGYFFFRFAGGCNILKRTSMVAGKRFGTLFDLIRLLQDKVSKIFQQNILTRKKCSHAIHITDGSQRPPKKNPIKTRDDSVNGIFMTTQKLLHGIFPLIMGFLNSIIWQGNTWSFKLYFKNHFVGSQIHENLCKSV